MGSARGLVAGVTVIGEHRQFVEAVTRQLTRLPGAVVVLSAEQEQREAVVRAAALDLLDAASSGVGSVAFGRAVQTLQADVHLLSSVFQNLDLFGVHDEVGIRVALLVGEALSTHDRPDNTSSTLQ